ncbi:MAG: hypothetical protein CMP48_20760 [Rickettsiales bacterium]|nr:hypothetical protein [Rickettsiales bacterium]
MKLFIYSLLLVISYISVAQRPDFESLKSAISEAKSEEARLHAITQYGDALPNNRLNEVLLLADSIEMGSDNSINPELANATSQFLKGISYYKSRDFIKAKGFLRNSAAYYSSVGSDIEFRAKNVLGLTYIRLREIDSAIYLYNEVLSRIPESNLQGRISTHGNLGSAYRQSGDNTKALEHLQAVYRLDSANAFTQINTAMNMAHIYQDMELYERSITTLKQVNIESAPPIPPKAVYYNNLANSFRKNEQIDSALYYFKFGLQVARQIKFEQGEFTALSNLIECQMALNQLDSIPNLIASLEKVSNARSMDAVLRVNFIKGQYHLKVGQPQEAITYLLVAEREANKPQLQGMKPGIYHQLIDAYNADENTVKAKEYIVKLDQFRESPANSKRERFLADAKANYLLAVTEQELDEKNKEVVDSSNKVIIFGGAAALLMVIAFVLFRLNKKSTETLVSQEQEKADLQKEIEKQRTQIIELKSKAVLETQEIVSIKSDGHYLEFSLRNKPKPEVDRNKLKDILEVLPDFFIQIHRSYIINIKEVRVKYADKVEMKNGDELPVSRKFKEEFNAALSKLDS